MKYKPVVLIVLDGWGYREEMKDNAIASAKKPFFDHLWQTYPHCLLKASGPAVGLPEGQIGTSEIGHLTIGAGQVVETELVRINKSITDGTFGQNPAFQKLFTWVKENNSTLQVMGLVSPGGIHSHSDHLYAFLATAKDAGVTKVAIHAFLDGRDDPPKSGADYLVDLENKIKEIGIGHIASVCGRYFAMDRDHNWDRTDIALKVITEGQEEISALSPSEAVRARYEQGESDEYLKPLIFSGLDGQTTSLTPNDAIFMFNFRTDRLRQLAHKLKEQMIAKNWNIATMTDYGDDLDLPAAFPNIKVADTLAKEISQAGLTQTHIAETEKFAHATYFLDGGGEKTVPGEKQILIESRKDIATHDQAPEMKAKEITDIALKEISAGGDFIFINYANADMVGHTANVPAIITAVETIDGELKRIVEAVTAAGGVALITADHGNAELNVDQATGKPHTAHTTNPVPCLLTTTDFKLRDGTLANIAGTILKLLELETPKKMERNLIDKL